MTTLLQLLKKQTSIISRHAIKKGWLVVPVFIFGLLIAFISYSQIDQKKLDSLSKSIDSSAKAYRAWQDSFNKVQDSIYHAAINKDLQNSRNLDLLAAEQKRKEAEERKNIILRIIVSIAILIIAAIVWHRRRKTKT